MKTRFQSIINGDQFTGGTPYDLREKVMHDIRQAFPKHLRLIIETISLNLEIETSESGKSFQYSTNLNYEQYKLILGSDFGVKNDTKKYSPKLTINQYGHVTIHSGGAFETLISNNRIFIE